MDLRKKMPERRRQESKESNGGDPRLEDAVIEIKRVSKKNKGGNRVSFSAMVAVGDRLGKIGVGLGKAPDVASAIAKANIKARKTMFTFPLNKKTITHSITVKRGACKVFLKPVPQGSGLIAGGAVRKVLELAGIKDISAKIMGANNKTLNVYATLDGLRALKK